VKHHKLAEMVRGWFIGPFNPSVFPTDAFECAVKTYVAGDSETPHMHKVATEITVIVHGVVKLNENEYRDGDIIEVSPGEVVRFEALTDATTVVVKVPAVAGDKYEC